MNKFVIKFRNISLILASILFAGSTFLVPNFALAQSLEIQELDVDVSGDDVLISWFTPVPASACVQFGLDTSYDLQICETTLERLHDIEIQSLTISTTYHFRVISATASGEHVSSLDRTFKTGRTGTFDVVTEIGDVEFEWIGATAATITWQTRDNSSSRVLYGKVGEDLGKRAGSSKKVTDHEVTLKKLDVNTSYHVQVFASTQDGRLLQSKVARFRTAAAEDIDEIDLKISNLRPTSPGDPAIRETSVVFSWDTSRPSDAKIRYGVNPLRLNKKVTQDDLDLRQHQIEAENLEPGTTYYFVVESKDIFNKKAVSPGSDGVHSVTTKGSPRIEADQSSTSITDTTQPQVRGLSTSRVARPVLRRNRNQVAVPIVSPLQSRPKVLGAFTYIYSPASALYTTAASDRVYAVVKGQKHWLKSPAITQSYGYRLSDTQTVPATQLASLPVVRLAKTPSSAQVFYIDENRNLRLHIPTPAAFDSYPSNSWEDIVTLSVQDMASYQEVQLIKTANSSRVYLLENGVRRPIASESAFNRWNLNWGQIVTVSQLHLESLPLGAIVN